MKKLLFVLLSLLLLPITGYATDRYAAPAGTTTSGNCTTNTTTSAACTPTYAYEGPMVAGDTLWLRGGVYTDPLNSFGGPDGTNMVVGSGAVVIYPYPGETATFRLDSGDSQVNAVYLGLGGDYTIVDGCPDEPISACTPRIVIDGVNGNPDSGSYDHQAGINGQTHIRWKGVEIVNGLGGFGVTCQSGWVSYMELQALHIHSSLRHNVPFGPPHAIHYGCDLGTANTDTNNVIEYNLIHDNGGASNSAAIECYTDAGQSGIDAYAQGTVIRNNKIYNNHVGLGINGGCKNAKVYNNLVYNNRLSGGASNYQLHLGGSTGVEVYNNTFADTGDAVETSGGGGASGLIFKNNICRSGCIIGGTTITNLQNSSNGTGEWSFNLTNDPLFANEGADDYHLTNSSPAIGAGTAIGIVTIDLDGNTRPNPPAIGAYELAGAEEGSDLEELFDAETPGATISGINNGTGWAGAWSLPEGTMTTENAPAGMTGMALRHNAAATARASRLMVAKNGDFLISATMQVSITPYVDGIGFEVFNGSGQYIDGLYFFGANITTGGGAVTVLTNYAVNTAYRADFHFDTVNHPGQFQARVDGGTFTAWTDCSATCSSVGKIEIANFETDAHTFWVDRIDDNDGPPVFPPSSVTPLGLRARVRGRI